MRVFFRKLGLEQVRFKPTYNPYTEVCDRLAIALFRNFNVGCAAVHGDLRVASSLEEMG